MSDDAAHCIICGKLFPYAELTNGHGASYECIPCFEETERILLDDDWWAKNGPKDD